MTTSYGHHPTDLADEQELNRPAHDAVAALITAELDDLPLRDQYGRHEAELRLDALFAALHAVDSTRYVVAPSKLAGVRARGFTVEDTWTGESLDWFPGQAQAARYAAEQNALNADECAADLAARATS